MSDNRPSLAAPRHGPLLEMARQAGGGFDIDAFHVMDKRDNALITDEILNGAGSSKFVYNFSIQGTEVSGISVIGARHLAAHYGGLKHRLIASAQKTGELFVFTSFPYDGMPMAVSASVVRELADEPDFYSVVVEISDIKAGNSVQVERRENRFESRRDKSQYERPNYATIAQSKAYRNGVLALIPQDVQIAWKAEMLKLGRGETLTASVIEEKRAGVLRFAAAKGLTIDRKAVEALTMDQIAGLADAARENVGLFVNSAKALGIMFDPETGEVAEALPAPQTEAAAEKRGRGRPPGSANKAAAQPAELTPAAPPADVAQPAPVPAAPPSLFAEE